MASLKKKPQQRPIHDPYQQFELINGRHPLQTEALGSHVLYRARIRPEGQLRFFNFPLAKEMGLITREHSDELNPDLEKAILRSFSLQIINEYDLEKNRKFPSELIKENFYMATRYLQLQHPSKLGRTSGDGRCIWNGIWKFQGKSWDISSSGTGATTLSPAAAIHQRNFKTGDPSVSYGCGLSEIDEAFSSLFYSEVFHQNTLPTERVLAVIGFPGKMSITVRVHENLLRPSHFFAPIKQGNLGLLRDLTSYHLKREIKNEPHSLNQLEFFLDQVQENFAKTAARFEDNYLFCWMDWDGDNILMDGGIIDYGSVRQLGLCHHRYRYDDTDRYSTNLGEQKIKCRYILQTFIQGMDFLSSGKKKAIKHFSKHKRLRNFDRLFADYSRQFFLERLGLEAHQVQFLLKSHAKTVSQLFELYKSFEKQVSRGGLEKTADGLNQPAIFDMKALLRELPQFYLVHSQAIPVKTFIEIMATDYCKPKELKFSAYQKTKIFRFQKLYLQIIQSLSEKYSLGENILLAKISRRSHKLNKPIRLTGDALTHIVNLILAARPRLKSSELAQLVQLLNQDQNCLLESQSPKIHLHQYPERIQKIFRLAQDIMKEHRVGL